MTHLVNLAPKMTYDHSSLVPPTKPQVQIIGGLHIENGDGRGSSSCSSFCITIGLAPQKKEKDQGSVELSLVEALIATTLARHLCSRFIESPDFNGYLEETNLASRSCTMATLYAAHPPNHLQRHPSREMPGWRLPDSRLPRSPHLHSAVSREMM